MSTARQAATRVFLAIILLVAARITQASPSDQDVLRPMRDSTQGAPVDAYQLPPTPPALRLVDRRIRCKQPLDYHKFHCGLLEVPIDWHNPTNDVGRVYYARYPASPEVTRRGTIFIDTGVPFAMSGAWTPQEWLSRRAETLHNLTHREYDIVVWDARGKGAHNLTIPGPVRCFTDAAERDRFNIYLDAEWALSQLAHRPERLRAEQDAAEIQKWHFVQSKIVEHCIAKQRPELLRNMGIASTTRDLAAMADAFDGPGSPINFWGMSYGSLVGAHLLYMFPERAGRVILDSPADLLAYTMQSSYETWKEDISHADRIINRYAQQCGGGSSFGCRVMPYNGTDSAAIGEYMRVHLWLARASLLGRRNTADQDLANSHIEKLFKTIVQHSADASDALYNITEAIAALNSAHAYADESLGLGAMPIFCGDKLEDHDPATALHRAREMMDSLKHDRASVPVLTNDAYPAVRFLCHLWPVRATERYPELHIPEGRTSPARPAQPFLVLGYAMDPLSKDDSLHQVVHTVPYGDASVRRVTQQQFGTPLFSHSDCMTGVIVDYLRNGTLPNRNRCWGDGVEELTLSSAGLLNGDGKSTSPSSVQACERAAHIL